MDSLRQQIEALKLPDDALRSACFEIDEKKDKNMEVL